MRFKTAEDHLLALEVASPEAFLVTVTEGGWAKRTALSEWNTKGRGTQGVRAIKLVERRGGLAGALVCEAEDEIFGIASNGVVLRTSVSGIRAAGRDTMGVAFMNVGENDSVVAVARSSAAQLEALNQIDEEDSAIAVNVEESEITEIDDAPDATSDTDGEGE